MILTNGVLVTELKFVNQACLSHFGGWIMMLLKATETGLIHPCLILHVLAQILLEVSAQPFSLDLPFHAPLSQDKQINMEESTPF